MSLSPIDRTANGIEVGDFVEAKPRCLGVDDEVTAIDVDESGNEWIWAGRGAGTVCVPARKYDIRRKADRRYR